VDILAITLSVISLVYGLAKFRTEFFNGSKAKLETKKLKQELESKKQKKLKK